MWKSHFDQKHTSILLFIWANLPGSNQIKTPDSATYNDIHHIMKLLMKRQVQKGYMHLRKKELNKMDDNKKQGT